MAVKRNKNRKPVGRPLATIGKHAKITIPGRQGTFCRLDGNRVLSSVTNRIETIPASTLVFGV